MNRLVEDPLAELLDALVQANHQATVYFHSRQYDLSRQWTQMANTIAHAIQALPNASEASKETRSPASMEGGDL